MNDQSTLDGDLPQYPRGSAQDPAGVRTSLPPSKTMAIWALVLACLPVPILWLVSIPLGLTVLGRSKDGVDHGKKLVIGSFVAIVCWALLIAAAFAAGVNTTPAERDSAGDLASRGDVRVEEIQVGDCLENDLGEDVALSTVEVLPCDEAHQLEAYANFMLPEGSWPGQDEIDRLSEGGCVKRFGTFVGMDFNESELEMVYLRPYEEGWAVDRGVTCFISTGSQTTGTLRLAER